VGCGRASRIRPMSVCVYGEEQIEKILARSKKLRIGFCVGAAGALAAAATIAWLRPEWIFGAGNHARRWVIGALMVFVAGPMADNLWGWNRHWVGMERALRAMRIEVSVRGVWLRSAGSERKFAAEEIRCAEEVPWGLYLRTAQRYRWMLIPARVAGFEELKREIGELGVAIVAARMAPNWEELVGGVVFTATMICAVFAQSTRVLAGDLIVSVIVAAAGYVVVSANPENLPKMRWARLGIFLPILMTGSMLWGAWRG